MLPYDNSMLTKDWTECSRPLTTDSEHVLGGLVDLDEDSVVDLPQSEQLKNLLDLGGHLVDTTDPHDKDKLGLSGDIVVSLLLGITLQPDLISLLILVLLGKSLSPLEDLDTLLSLVDLSLDGELGPVGSVLCLPLATLENSLGDCGELCVGHLLKQERQHYPVLTTDHVVFRVSQHIMMMPK